MPSDEKQTSNQSIRFSEGIKRFVSAECVCIGQLENGQDLSTCHDSPYLIAAAKKKRWRRQTSVSLGNLPIYINVDGPDAIHRHSTDNIMASVYSDRSPKVLCGQTASDPLKVSTPIQGMRFGQTLQGKSSHDALVALQDAEIRLLENIKKCLTLRVKVDRDYANGLGDLVAAANRLDTSDFKLPIFLAWETIVKETEGQQRLIHENTEYMCRRTLDRLCHLITEKKDARKFYVEERQRLQVEFDKLKEEPQKLKGDYEKLLEKFNNEKSKFDEVHSKGKAGGKYEDAKTRFCRAGGKLHKMHNDYIISLRDVNKHQQHYLATTLPGLLNYQQEVQETMVHQSKQVLEEYVNHTNTSNEKFTASHRKMQQLVSVINKETEYQEYLDTHKSDPLEASKFEFCTTLLNDYNGRLRADEVALDDLTLSSLKECRTSFETRTRTCKEKRDTKENDLKALEESLRQKPPEADLAEQTRKKLDSFRSSRKPLGKRKNPSSFDEQQHALLILKKEVAELNCTIDKTETLYTLMNTPLVQLGDNDPPPAVDLPGTPAENGRKTPVRSTSSSDGGGPSPSPSNLSLLRKFNPFKRPNIKHTLPDPDADRETNHHDDPPSPVRDRQSVVEVEPVTDYQQYNTNDEVFQPDTLDDMDLFHGILPRDEVQRLLVNDGDFLVRESQNRKTGQTQYVLSVMWTSHKHFIIQGHQGGWRFEGQHYPTIPELVMQQYRSKLPVTNRSQAILYTPIPREVWELKNDDVIKEEKIDNGHFGEVFRGTYKVTNQEVAIKICRETLSEDAKKKFLSEGRILKQYDHPNIVRFIGIAAQRQPVMIVMEYVPGGSLLKFMQTKGAQLTSKQMIKMCEDASAGMAYLEQKGCIHRDLAARNCLVGKNQVVKISDFGMSREEEVYRVSDGLKQIPIKWTAPEALNLGEYTSMCDVWSYGVLMWEVFSCGEQPYNGQTNNQAREKIETGYRMPAPEGTPELVYALMLRCWDGKPTNRPRFSEIHQELGRLRTVL